MDAIGREETSYKFFYLIKHRYYTCSYSGKEGIFSIKKQQRSGTAKANPVTNGSQYSLVEIAV
jgi:hypothetical protein